MDAANTSTVSALASPATAPSPLAATVAGARTEPVAARRVTATFDSEGHEVGEVRGSFSWYTTYQPTVRIRSYYDGRHAELDATAILDADDYEVSDLIDADTVLAPVLRELAAEVYVCEDRGWARNGHAGRVYAWDVTPTGYEPVANDEIGADIARNLAAHHLAAAVGL